MSNIKALRSVYRRLHKSLVNSMFSDNYHFNEVIFPREEHVPDIECVYFIFDDDLSLIYIGQTRNLRNRLHGHHIYDKDVHLLGIWETSTDDERLATEKWLIQRHTPPMNIQYLYGVTNA